MSISTHLGFGALVAVSILMAAGSASAAVDLTGCWYAPTSGGTVYITQRGSTLWWVGVSRDGGVSWMNSYHGNVSDSVVTGDWADVPRGRNRLSGNLSLSIVDGSSLQVISATGGFGDTSFKRIACP
jgi:hypothetical protein